jgi:hypothetical protein
MKFCIEIQSFVNRQNNGGVPGVLLAVASPAGGAKVVVLVVASVMVLPS